MVNFFTFSVIRNGFHPHHDRMGWLICKLFVNYVKAFYKKKILSKFLIIFKNNSRNENINKKVLLMDKWIPLTLNYYNNFKRECCLLFSKVMLIHATSLKLCSNFFAFKTWSWMWSVVRGPWSGHLKNMYLDHLNLCII